MFSACQETLEDRCVREAKEYSVKHCPVAVAENIVIDSLTFDKASHTLHYYYSLSGKLDDADVIKKNDAKKLLLDQLKNTTSMKVYKDAGFLFAYTYYSAKEPTNILFETVFTKKDYQP